MLTDHAPRWDSGIGSVQWAWLGAVREGGGARWLWVKPDGNMFHAFASRKTSSLTGRYNNYHNWLTGTSPLGTSQA